MFASPPGADPAHRRSHRVVADDAFAAARPARAARAASSAAGSGRPDDPRRAAAEARPDRPSARWREASDAVWAASAVTSALFLLYQAAAAF